MRVFQSFLATSLLVLLSGCGGGISSIVAALTPTYPALTGNWSLAGTSQLTSKNIGDAWLAGGYLTNTNGAVSGTLHILDSPCFLLTQDIPVTGSVTASDVSSSIKLTSAAVSGQVIVVTGSVVTAGGAIALNASYTVTGGCADGDKGTVIGSLVASITNTYTGSFVSGASKVSVPVSMALTQGAPNSDGYYEVSGTITFTGSSCFTTGTIASSALAGSYIELTVTTDKGGTVQFVGAVTPVTGAITGTYAVLSGICAADYGTVSLTHP